MKMRFMISRPRFAFASRYASRHLLVSLLVALASTAAVGVWYAPPWRQMQQIGNIYLLVLAVDVVCGPLLTLILASPLKSRRECWLDLSLVGLIQLLALAYGMHSVWAARPVALVFEVDRMVLVTANEIEPEALTLAPPGVQQLSWSGKLLKVGTRKPKDETEMISSLDQSLAGISAAQRPSWWLPWSATRTAMRERAKPLSELISRRPEDAHTLYAAAQRSGRAVESLVYLPLVSSKTLEWVALLDADLEMVGYAPVDGF